MRKTNVNNHWQTVSTAYISVAMALTAIASVGPDTRKTQDSTIPENIARKLDQIHPTELELAEAKRLRVDPRETKAFVFSLRNPLHQKLDLSKPLVSSAALLAAKAASASAADPCPNGGFESNNFTAGNWLGATGTFSVANTTNSLGVPQLNLNPFSAFGFVTTILPATSQHTILPAAGWGIWNGPVDPTVAATPPFAPAIPVPFPAGGVRTLRLGNRTSGCGAEAIMRSFLVTASNARFGFEYAIVCQNPSSHPTADQPRLIYQLVIGSSVVDSFDHYANISDSFWNAQSTASSSPILWRRVSCHIKDLTPYIGQTATVIFVNTDCAQGAHWGYSYLDRFCDQNLGKPILSGLQATYCQGDPIVADGHLTSGVTSSSWSVVQLDSTGNEVLTTKRSSAWVPGPISSNFDVKSWYGSHGGKWTCGARYKVSLTIDTECTTHETTSQVVSIDCCENINCCENAPVKVAPANLTPLQRIGAGTFTFAPTITWNGGAKRVEMTIANVVIATQPWSGQLPAFGYMKNISPLVTMASLTMANQPCSLPFSRVARWESSVPTPSGSGAVLGTTLRFPVPVPNKITYLKFTVKYAVFDADCKACETYQTYAYEMDDKKIKPIALSSWPKAPPVDASNGLNLPNASFIPGPKTGGGGGVNPALGPPQFQPNSPVWPPSILNCCGDLVPEAKPASLRPSGMGNVWAFSPVVSFGGILWARMEVTMMNVAVATSNSLTYPAYGFISAPGSAAGFAPPQLAAVPYSHIVRWVRPTGALINGLSLPMKLAFPQPPASGPLYVTFTMKFAAASRSCKECELYQNYYFRLERGKEPIAILPSEWPSRFVEEGGNPPPPFLDSAPIRDAVK